MQLRARSVVRAALLLFVAVTCGLLVAKELRRARELRAAATPARVAPASARAQVVVTYFHNTNRCPSCLRIEEFTAASMTESLGAEMAEGRVGWRVVNVDLPVNAHFVGDYGLYTKSVIVSDQRGGREIRWKNLDQVWHLLNDPAAFRAYVEREVRAYLESA